MYQNDPNFSSYAQYASYAAAKGNTPLSESSIGYYVSQAISRGLSPSVQQGFLASNPGDWGRLDTAFDVYGIAPIGSISVTPPQGGGFAPDYATPNGGGLSASAIAAQSSDLAIMSLTGAVSGGGQLVVPNVSIAGPTLPPGSAPVVNVAGSPGIPSWVFIAAIAIAVYYFVSK